jgi:hypothetical protein
MTAKEQIKMTKVMKWLGGSLAALLLLGVAGAFTAGSAQADSPPGPPARFVGSVTVDGAKPVAGTIIQAKVGDASCGATSVFMANGEARYAFDVPARDPGSAPNCGEDGATVSFYVDGDMADQTGTWHDYQLNIVNLTVTPAPTPEVPDTGSGLANADGASGASWLFAAFGVVALAAGLGGVTAVRRTRS